MSGLIRWNDDRLDDLARQVQRNGQQLEENAKIREELVKVRERLANVSGDTHSCITELRQLKGELDRRAQVQHEERKADRKWMIGTVLVTAGLVIAALGVFLG
jgi:hypothetical protein